MFLVRKGEISNRLDSLFYFEITDCLGFIKLSNVAKISGGKRLPAGYDFSSEITKYRYLRVGDINWHGNLDYKNFNYLPKKVYFLLQRYEIFSNELLIAIVGATIGKVALLKNNSDDKIILTENCAKISIKRKDVLPEYLFIILQSSIVQKQIQLNFIQTTLPKLGLERLESLRIPVIPDLSIQSKIVSIFEIASLSKKQKEAKAAALLASIDGYLLQELGITLPPSSEKKTYFLTRSNQVSGGRFDPFYHLTEFDIFNNALQKSKFDLEKISNICFDVRGVTYSNADETKEGKKILRANNIDLKTNELNLSDIRYIREDFEISDNQLLRKNDIFMCAASGSKEHSGKVAFIEENIDFYFGGFMMVLRSNKNILPKYLFEVLASSIFRRFLTKILGGTNINNLNFSMFKNYKIPLPPLEKQIEIADHISALRTQAKQLQQQATAELAHAKLHVEQLILGETT